MAFKFYEFFAGGGMARLGLRERWQCLFANDIDPNKTACYRENFGGEELVVGDIAKIGVSDLPGRADLAWASFPCQDLSLAGNGAGLCGVRSGTFWPFWSLIEGLGEEGRAPRLVVLENVCGALSSHGGKDFSAIASAMVAAGYRFGALVIDAAGFVPQSRPRLFVVAILGELKIPKGLTMGGPAEPWHTEALITAYHRLPMATEQNWVWWSLPQEPGRTAKLQDLIEDEPTGVSWHTPAETRRLLSLMSPINRNKVRAIQRTGQRMVGCLYKRTRPDEEGAKRQRAEVRFDNISGCLRTPVGGSSRQTIVVVEGDSIRSRLLSPREAARLMGLPERYRLPGRYNDAYHVAGDGLVVPVVRHLAAHLLEPLLEAGDHGEKQAVHRSKNQNAAA